MADINRVEIRGRLTRDPELRYTPSGVEVANFSVATGYTPKNGEKKTEFHQCVAWRDAALTVAEQKKGDELHFSGRLQTQKWEGTDGSKRSKVEIVVWEFMEEPGEENQERQARVASKPKAAVKTQVEKETDEQPQPRDDSDAPLDPDDVPF